MNEISFTSTYRIPITQAGVNSAKKAKLKELIQSYPNGLIGNSKVGHARVSMADSEDENFVRKLKGIGYRVFQRFDGEDISKESLDAFIKEKLDTRNYNQLGKNKKRMSTQMKLERRYRNNAIVGTELERQLAEQAKEVPPVVEKAQKDEYDYLVKEYGQEFVDAIMRHERKK